MTYQLPLNNLQIIKSDVIDLKVQGVTLLFIPEKNFLITDTIILSTNLDGMPDTCSGSIGTNSPDYDNINPAVSPFFDNQGEFYQYENNFSAVINLPIYLNITSPDTTSVTDEAVVYLIGFYV